MTRAIEWRPSYHVRERCGAIMRYKQQLCGSPVGHPGAHRSEVRLRIGTAATKRRINTARSSLMTKMLEVQEDRCGICSAPHPTDMDHDHRCCSVRMTHCVKRCGCCERAMLCNQCNATLIAGYERARDMGFDVYSPTLDAYCDSRFLVDLG
jgi:hypothetical protein